MNNRHPQSYSPEEFDAVVAMIQNDPDLRDDIEAISGLSLDGKTPRELFNAFQTIRRATDLQAVVVNYGRARQAVRDTRADLETNASAEDALKAARTEIGRLEKKVEELKRKDQARAITQGATPLRIAGGGRA